MSGNRDRVTPAKPAAPPGAARQARVVALVIGGLSLALIGAFIAMVFFVQDEVPLHAVGPVAPGPGAKHGGLVFQGTVNVWTVNGRVALDAGRNARVAVALTTTSGEPAPTGLPLSLALDMAGADGPTLPMSQRLVAPGSYVANAQLPSAGRWRLRIELPQVTGVFELDVPDD